MFTRVPEEVFVGHRSSGTLVAPCFFVFFFFCIPVPACLFLISSNALGSSGLWFLVARPETISSILSSSKTCCMHTYRARTLETGVDTHSDIGFQLAQLPRWEGR